MSTIGAVILAAGASSRFGRSKQIAVYLGEPLVRRVLVAAVQAGSSPIAVVAGEGAGAIGSHLSGLPYDLVLNERWHEGIASSVRAGVQHLIARTEKLKAIVILACDQPFVDAHTVRQLIDLHQESGKAIAACGYGGTVGIPAVFACSRFHALLELEGDHGAKALIIAQPDDLATLDFPDGAIDIDTPADYQRLIAAN